MICVEEDRVENKIQKQEEQENEARRYKINCLKRVL